MPLIFPFVLNSDLDEDRRRTMSKGLLRVVSDVDVTRKHRDTIANMTLSDINLCTAGSTTISSNVSTMSSASSTRTSTAESVSLSPESSVFGAPASKMHDGSMKTYAAQRGRRRRPPTR